MAEMRSLAGRQALGLAVTLCAAIAASYVLTRFGRTLLSSGLHGSHSGASTDSLVPPSGSYLVAYVMVSESCSACQDERTKTALKSLRDSLRSSHSAGFAKIVVVGVSLDGNESGVRYLQAYGPVFDQMSTGGGWMNEIITEVVWRDAMAPAAVPAVVLLQRHVDANRFPKDIMIGDDSLLVSVSGRDSLVQWVNAGTPLVLRSRTRPERR